jgi:hypothetical protein
VGDDEKITQSEVLFFQVVSMFQLAAMQQMGKMPNPLTNRIERALDQAKMSVDILSMLKEKTAGNLSKREQEYLGKALFECQMNYLDELKRPEAGAGEAASRGTGEDEGREPGREPRAPDEGPPKGPQAPEGGPGSGPGGEET